MPLLYYHSIPFSSDKSNDNQFGQIQIEKRLKQIQARHKHIWELVYHAFENNYKLLVLKRNGDIFTRCYFRKIEFSCDWIDEEKDEDADVIFTEGFECEWIKLKTLKGLIITIQYLISNYQPINSYVKNRCLLLIEVCLYQARKHPELVTDELNDILRDISGIDVLHELELQEEKSISFRENLSKILLKYHKVSYYTDIIDKLYRENEAFLYERPKLSEPVFLTHQLKQKLFTTIIIAYKKAKLAYETNTISGKYLSSDRNLAKELKIFLLELFQCDRSNDADSINLVQWCYQQAEDHYRHYYDKYPNGESLDRSWKEHLDAKHIKENARSWLKSGLTLDCDDTAIDEFLDRINTYDSNILLICGSDIDIVALRIINRSDLRSQFTQDQLTLLIRSTSPTDENSIKAFETILNLVEDIKFPWLLKGSDEEISHLADVLQNRFSLSLEACIEKSETVSLELQAFVKGAIASDRIGYDLWLSSIFDKIVDKANHGNKEFQLLAGTILISSSPFHRQEIEEGYQYIYLSAAQGSTEAFKALEQASHLDYVKCYIAKLYLKKHDLNKAFENFSKIEQSNDHDKNLTKEFGDLVYEEGKKFLEDVHIEQAFAFLSKVPIESEYYRDAMFECGHIFFLHFNQPAQAAACFLKVIELGDERVKTLYLVAKAKAEGKDITMCDLYPQMPVIQDNKEGNVVEEKHHEPIVESKWGQLAKFCKTHRKAIALVVIGGVLIGAAAPFIIKGLVLFSSIYVTSAICAAIGVLATALLVGLPYVLYRSCCRPNINSKEQLKSNHPNDKKSMIVQSEKNVMPKQRHDCKKYALQDEFREKKYYSEARLIKKNADSPVFGFQRPSHSSHQTQHVMDLEDSHERKSLTL